MRRPVLLLDVDGVVNALRPAGEWADYVMVEVVGGGVTWPITYSPTVVRRLNAIHADGLAEIRWLTTWEDEAASNIAPALGFLDFVVAGVQVDHRPTGFGESWWKWTVAKAYDPERQPLAWVDDDLGFLGYYEALAWARRRPQTLALAPAAASGLLADDLDTLETWLKGCWLAGQSGALGEGG